MRHKQFKHKVSEVAKTLMLKERTSLTSYTEKLDSHHLCHATLSYSWWVPSAFSEKPEPQGASYTPKTYV